MSVYAVSPSGHTQATIGILRELFLAPCCRTNDMRTRDVLFLKQKHCSISQPTHRPTQKQCVTTVHAPIRQNDISLSFRPSSDVTNQEKTKTIGCYSPDSKRAYQRPRGAGTTSTVFAVLPGRGRGGDGRRRCRRRCPTSRRRCGGGGRSSSSREGHESAEKRRLRTRCREAARMRRARVGKNSADD